MDCVQIHQGFYREAKCQLLLGEVAAALHLYKKVLELDPNNKAAASEVGTKLMGAHSLVG